MCHVEPELKHNNNKTTVLRLMEIRQKHAEN